MHLSLMLILLSMINVIPSSLANIIFRWIQPNCNSSLPGWNGCLRGQICETDGTCKSSARNYHSFNEHDISTLSKRQYSADGQCGPNNGDLLCDPDSTSYTGICCSQYGWCGNTDAHCGAGCVANCSNTASMSMATFLLSSTILASSNGMKLVSSRPAIGEPTISVGISTTTTSFGTSATSAVTTDGTCGANYAGTVCGDWYKGSCCSMYGYCGNTTAHCSDGCQSGPCIHGATALVPGPSAAPANANPGSFIVVGQSGVPVMHAGLMENGRAIFLDKVEDYTQLNLPNGEYAYSAEYDPLTNQVVPLAYQTNAFCSGGIFLADGRLLDVGGNAPLTAVDPTIGDGFTAIRYLTRSSTDSSLNGQSWSEPGNKLNTARWYGSAQIMPDGTIFVASGSRNGLDPTVAANNNPTFEILDSEGITNGQSVPLDILERTQPYYMYPFIHLLQDGSLFIFASKSAELFDVSTRMTILTFEDLPGDYRTYPNTGGSVLLPLSSGNDWNPDIVICGGGAYQDITSPTDASCGRIQPLSNNPAWEMDSMPEGRTMVEGTLLPDGTVVWLNGCSQGAQGFGLGADPAYEALIYDPAQPLGQRFTTGGSTTIARLYHSVAFLLLDGTVMVAGSNPVQQPILTPDADNPYVTEFRVEIYTPPYLSGPNVNRRPTSIVLSSTALAAGSSTFCVSFTAPSGANSSSVVLYYGGFVTHNLHMGHRMVILDTTGWVEDSSRQMLTVTMPPSSNVAPPGPYVVYVLCDGVPGIGQFVSVS